MQLCLEWRPELSPRRSRVKRLKSKRRMCPESAVGGLFLQGLEVSNSLLSVEREAMGIVT